MFLHAYSFLLSPPRPCASGRVEGEPDHKSKSNPNPLGEGFMPPPYPLHGSGSVPCWSAFPKYLVLRAIKNRFYFLIVFRCHLASILGPISDPFWSLFDAQIDPSSVQDAFSSLIFFKNVIFTKTYKNPLILNIFDPKIDPKTTQDRPKTDPRGC
jgi:hypothetical protein